MPFLIRKIADSNLCSEVFSSANVTVIFRNSSQMFIADVLQIRPWYFPAASLPNVHSLCIQSLKRLAVGITARRPGFKHGSVLVGFVFTEVTMGLVFFPSHSLLLANILPPNATYSSNVYWTVHYCNDWRMKDQLDVTCYFFFTYYVLNMFRTLIYPSSGACDCVDELPHRSSCSQFVVCLSFCCG